MSCNFNQIIIFLTLFLACLRSSSAIRSLIIEKKKSVQNSTDQANMNEDEINEKLNPDSEKKENVDEGIFL